LKLDDQLISATVPYITLFTVTKAVVVTSRTRYASDRNSQPSDVGVFDCDSAYVDNRTVTSLDNADCTPFVEKAVN